MQKNNENGNVQITRRYDKPVRIMPQKLSSSGDGSASVNRKKSMITFVFTKKPFGHFFSIAINLKDKAKC